VEYFKQELNQTPTNNSNKGKDNDKGVVIDVTEE
jgi:hypothetical protein